MHVEGDLDLADALDFNTALAADAHAQLLLGSTESLDVRRSIAAGNLARHQLALDLTDTDASRARRRGKREVVLHVHLADAALARRRWVGAGPGDQGAGHRRPGPPVVRQPRHAVTVQPVLDLGEHLQVGSYEATARLKLQTQLRDGTCVFAFCYRPAEDCDCDHRVPPPG